jgi:translation initiation factor IF-3
VNDKIRVREVRLIDDEGAQVGVVPTRDALKMAEERELDLVEVAPNAVPPVCRIMDFGKFKYQMSKKQTVKKTADIKMIKLRPRIDEGDLQRKVRDIKGFIADGHKVKVTMFFRGRERGRPDLGMKVFDRIKTMMDEGYTINQEPKQEGANISMILAPGSKS